MPDYEQYTTLGESTLASDYTAGGGSLTLASAASFPTGPLFSVRVNRAAIYKATAVAGAVLSVTLEAGSDVNVGSGASVVEVLTQRALDQIRADAIRSGTRANLPASGFRKKGDLYLSEDSGSLHVFDGSDWAAKVYGGIYKKKEISSSFFSGFTWVNQDNATATYSNGRLIWVDGGLAATEWHYAWIATPTAPWTLDVILSGPWHITSGDFPSMGIGCGGGTTWSTLGYGMGSAGVLGMQGQNLTGTTVGTYTGQLSANGLPQINGGPIRIKIVDDGSTNRVWSVSPDLENFPWSYTEGRTARFTADRVMLFSRSSGTATNNAGFSLDSWDLTSP